MIAIDKICLWEILVPVYNYSFGRTEITHEHHERWDNKVQQLSGGLSILNPIKGKWLSEKEGGLIKEPMLPVRIACTQSQMEEIAQFTMEHYQQECIMYYKISDQVIFYTGIKS